MAFHNRLYNRMLDTAAGEAVEASLHSEEPDSSGSDEISGGSYERQSISWDSASSGSVSVDGEIVWPVASETTVSHVGLWDEAGDWLGWVALNDTEQFVAPGTLTVDPLTLSMGDDD